MFPVDISELSPQKEVDISIGLVPMVAPTSKVPYKMSTLELVDMKIQLKEITEKGYIRPSVSSYRAPILFMKKKDCTLRLCIDYR